MSEKMKEKIALRKAVAKDVLAQLAAGKYHPESIYFTMDLVRKTPFKLDTVEQRKATQLQRYLKGDFSCEVCGIGSLFASFIRKEDNFTLDRVALHSDITSDGASYLDIEVGRHQIVKALSPIFSRNELDVIESAFELSDCGILRGNAAQRNRILAAVAWGEQFYGSKKRMTEIMKEIIRTGKFEPDYPKDKDEDNEYE